MSSSLRSHGFGAGRSGFARGRAVRAAQAGFAYLALLILLAILGLVGAALLQLGVVSHRRSAEQALLDIGAAYGDALESYRKRTPVGQPDAPTTLQDLLRDPRFAAPVRHLRQLYADPITGGAQWGIVTQRGRAGIIGIHSLSQARPIKIGNFAARFQGFDGKAQYKDWVFLRYQPANAPGLAPVAEGAPAVPQQGAADSAPPPAASLFAPVLTAIPATPVAMPAVPVQPAPSTAAPATAAGTPPPDAPAAEPPDVTPPGMPASSVPKQDPPPAVPSAASSSLPET